MYHRWSLCQWYFPPPGLWLFLLFSQQSSEEDSFAKSTTTTSSYTTKVPTSTTSSSTTKVSTSTMPPTEGSTLDVYAALGLAGGAVVVLLVVVVLANVTVCWCWMRRNRAKETNLVLYDYINDPVIPPARDDTILGSTNPAYTTTIPVPVSANEAYGMATTDTMSNEAYMTIDEAAGETAVDEEHDTTTDVITSTNEAYVSTTTDPVYDN